MNPNPRGGTMFKEPIRTRLLVILVAQALVSVSCGGAGNEYVGTWDGARGQMGCLCPLTISKNGASFVIEPDETNCNSCDHYRGIWTLSGEGNLSGMGGFITMSFDKAKKQIVLPGDRGMQYLTKRK
jgi:hypothetical protein